LDERVGAEATRFLASQEWMLGPRIAERSDVTRNLAAKSLADDDHATLIAFCHVRGQPDFALRLALAIDHRSYGEAAISQARIPARKESITAIRFRSACRPCITIAMTRLNSGSVRTLACFNESHEMFLLQSAYYIF